MAPVPSATTTLPPAGRVTDDELTLYAAFLARDFDYDQNRARAKPAIWYQRVVGRETFTIHHASELRYRTMEWCRNPLLRIHRLKLFPEPSPVASVRLAMDFMGWTLLISITICLLGIAATIWAVTR